MTNDELMDAQGEIADILNEVRSLECELTCAESCETSDNFVTNLAEAEAYAISLLREIRRMRKEYK